MSKPVIMFVDDEPDVLDTLKEQVKNYTGDNFMFEAAENVEEAWEVIDELEGLGVRIFLIASDCLTPGDRGDQFLIDVHEKHPHIVKVLLAGRAEKDAIDRVRREAHLHRCLLKPWKESSLIETIQTGVEKLWNP
ncbi:MAG: response regulator [Desulfobacterales bacterium]|nr:response regulator [Desulfobacterales bacterium]